MREQQTPTVWALLRDSADGPSVGRAQAQTGLQSVADGCASCQAGFDTELTSLPRAAGSSG